MRRSVASICRSRWVIDRVGTFWRSEPYKSPVDGRGFLFVCAQFASWLRLVDHLCEFLANVAMSRVCRLRSGRFVCLPAAESLFFVGPKKSNPKKGHPGARALRVRERVTGFFDSTSCADEKLAGLPASHPAGYPPPVRRALRGPGLRARAARHARTSGCRFAPVEQQRRRTICLCSLPFALLFCSFKSARFARKGPLMR